MKPPARVLVGAYAACVLAIPVCLVIGHQGVHGLSWKANQVSTYAARAPLDLAITVGMVLTAVTLVLLSALIERLVSSRLVAAGLSSLYAMAAAGIGLIAVFEETVSGGRNLLRSKPGVAYAQGFHDAGLYLFLTAGGLALLVTGLALLVHQRGWKRKLLAGLVLLTPIGAEVARQSMVTHPQLVGLYQRLLFASMWVALVVLAGLLWERKAEA